MDTAVGTWGIAITCLVIVLILVFAVARKNLTNQRGAMQPEREWPTGLKIADHGNKVLVSQNGREYFARKWRLTPEVVSIVDTANKYGIVANWVEGHPSNSYLRGGKDFAKGSHHITFARSHKEGWIFVLGGESKPPNFRFVTFNHRYWSFVHSTGLPYRWEHSGGHNVYVLPEYLDPILAKLTHEVIDEVESRRTRSHHGHPVLPRAGITNEYDLELAFLDRFNGLPKTIVFGYEVRTPYLGLDGRSKIPDVLVHLALDSCIVVELKFPAGNRAHIDQLQGYLQIPAIVNRCKDRLLPGVLIARSFEDELIQLVNEQPNRNLSLYRYGFDDRLITVHCAGPQVLEQHGLG